MSGTQQPYTDDKTRIILSFANNGAGDLFAHWLRDRLMKTLSYYSDNAVYLDNVASRNAPGGEVKPDLRGKDFDPTTGTTSDGSYVTIGAMHPDWFKMWSKALSQAKVVIQIQTKEYSKSTSCEREMAEISNALKSRNILAVLAIAFDDDVPVMAMGHDVPPTGKMHFNKVPGTTDALSPLQHLKGSWVISNSDFARVTDFVTAKGSWATRSVGCIQREPARHAWDTGHRRRASHVRWRRSTR